MGKVTSKLQVTVPKALAKRYGIRPGDEIEWQEAGDAIRVVAAARPRGDNGRAERLRSFDQATLRQRRRQQGTRRRSTPKTRGWKREDLYERGRPG